MGKSYIISSNNKSFVENTLNKIMANLLIDPKDSSGDYLKLELADKKNSISIDQIHYLKTWSKAKPYKSGHKIAVIFDADKMTLEAQNSMLKMLEEPSKSNNYVLISTNHSKFLETILSRCELILDTSIKQEGIDVSTFIEMNTLQKLDYANRLSAQKDVQARNEKLNKLLFGLLNHYRQQLLAGQGVVSKIEIINHTKKLLDSNVSPKNALIYLCLNIDNLA